MPVNVHVREILEIPQDCGGWNGNETMGLWKGRIWKGKQMPKQTRGNPVAVTGRGRNGPNTKKNQSKTNKLQTGKGRQRLRGTTTRAVSAT